MEYATHIPGLPLSHFVEYLWCLRDAPAHTTERIVPSGTLELVVNLCEDELPIYASGGARVRYSGAVVSGAYQRSFAIDTRAHASIVGVHFRPGGAGAVLGVPPGELADRHVDLDGLWGRPAIALREQLCAATTAGDRFAVLESYLRSRLRDKLEGHGAVPVALEQLARPEVSVRDVAASVNLSWRRLIEVFTAQVGMTPKRLSRVLRFQRACQVARQSSSPDWGRVAQVCGYFDQSHLIHDIRELSGFSPMQLLGASKEVKDNHAVVPDGVKFLQAHRAARR
jgi:AraC-like DNA-binding protein